MRFISTVPLLGDAPYCTPEQYKDCAEPALGKCAHQHDVRWHKHAVLLVYISFGLVEDYISISSCWFSVNAKPALNMSNVQSESLTWDDYSKAATVHCYESYKPIIRNKLSGNDWCIVGLQWDVHDEQCLCHRLGERCLIYQESGIHLNISIPLCVWKAHQACSRHQRQRLQCLSSI